LLKKETFEAAQEKKKKKKKLLGLAIKRHEISESYVALSNWGKALRGIWGER
jgi:hypothetical protein